MKIGNGQFLDQAACVFKGPFGLSRKPDHHINSYGYMRHLMDYVQDQVSVKLRAIRSVHPLKHIIVSALQRDVQVRTNVLRGCQLVDEVF